MTRDTGGDLPVALRALHSHDELSACVRLQRETWGAGYADIVPASILQVAQKVGGIAGGAFDADDALVGFVFGMTGIRHGRPVHWSHMLAVRPDLRDHGIGRRLKEFQRESLLATGVDVMYWTFDPLVARNAHLNLNRLGVTVDEYVPDMYGDTGSELHRFGTDRLIVSWPLRQQAPRKPIPASELTGIPVVENGCRPEGPRVRVEIPRDVEAIFARDPDGAVAWRDRSRRAFLACVNEGYHVEAFRDSGDGHYYYVLRRGEAGSEARP